MKSSRRRPMVLDGGLSDQLTSQGCNFKGRLWTARLLRDDPKQILQAHRAFLKSGAECLITSTYQASPRGFAKEGFTEKEIADCFEKSIVLAKQACAEHTHENPDANTLIAASIGPYGAFLADGSEYRGDYETSSSNLKAFHEERFAYLTHHQPDFFACETIPTLSEAIALGQLLDGYRTPGWISFTCKNGMDIVDGTPLVECYQALLEYEHVKAIGINCTAPQHILPLIESLQPYRKDRLDLVIYPNGGAEYDITTQAWSAKAALPEFFTALPTWLLHKPMLIGGCCGIGTKEIAAIRKVVDEYSWT
ncbi:MAG: homocysteine S-methyltransferase [Saprospiraceae bacterium]|nr:homocysteine S-methyltransferase [Saprospiraceae bacterium]